MKATELTNHGAALVGEPLNRRWNDAPVKLRCDIEAHAKRVRGYWMEEPLDKLAEIMERLSLGSASFGNSDGGAADAFVKSMVALHHRTWLMRPLEGLYDELKKAAEPAEAGTTNSEPAEAGTTNSEPAEAGTTNPATELLQLIDQAVFESRSGMPGLKLWDLVHPLNTSVRTGVWQGSAEILEDMLCGHDGWTSSVSRPASKLLGKGRLISMLQRLREDKGDRVDKGDSATGRGWRISAAPATATTKGGRGV